MGKRCKCHHVELHLYFAISFFTLFTRAFTPSAVGMSTSVNKSPYVGGLASSLNSVPSFPDRCMVVCEMKTSGIDSISRELLGLAEAHNMAQRNSNGRWRNKLQPRHASEFPSDSLFDQFARIVCKVTVIPRKEVFETWAMALYVHHYFPTAKRIADLACSHGLLSWALLLLAYDDSEMESRRSVVCVDIHMPKSAEKIAGAMLERWPHFEDDWDYVEGHLEAVQPDSSTLLVGIHACGLLSDKIISLAIGGNASLALVPCCHSKKCLSTEQKLVFANTTGHTSPVACLSEIVDKSRIERLRKAGFQVEEALIPKVFTPKNRIILALPAIERKLNPSFHDQRTESTARKLSVTMTGKPTWGMPKFVIPLADTPISRTFVRSLAGRIAADHRKRSPPPSLCISMFLPPDRLDLSSEDLQDADLGLPRQAQFETVCKEPFLHPKYGRYARTFRVHYNDCTKAEAKGYHASLREKLPSVFIGAEVRY